MPKQKTEATFTVLRLNTDALQGPRDLRWFARCLECEQVETLWDAPIALTTLIHKIAGHRCREVR